MASRASSDVVVRFIGDTGNLDKGLDNLSGRFTAITSSLKGIAAAGAVVGAIAFFKGAIQEAEEAERVGRKTLAVVKSTGQVAGVTADQIGDLAGELSNLAGVDDEVIQQGENVLLTFTQVRNSVGKGNDIFNQAAGAALDMAAALDQSGDSGAAYQENVIRLGKALNDPIAGLTALKKVGVSFTEDQKKQIETMVKAGDTMGAQKVILAELQREFGGAAEANATASGKAAVAWGNFAEAVGEKVMPAVTAFGQWLTQTGIPVMGHFADVVGDQVIPVLHDLWSFGGDIVDTWRGLPGPIQAGAVALGAWLLVGDKVSGVFSRMSGNAKGFGSDVSTAMGAFDVNRFTGTFMAMEERIPVLGQMGSAFRENSSLAIGLGGAMGGLEGRMTQFGGVLKGVASSALVGFKAGAMGIMNMMGGPWGLALAGAGIVVGLFVSKVQAAKAETAKWNEFGKRNAEIMHDLTDATSAATRAKIAQNAEDSGLLDKARKLGVSTQDVVDALMGEKGARERVNAAMDTTIDKHDQESNFLTQGLDLIANNTDGLSTLTEQRDAFNQAMGESNDAYQKQKQLQEQAAADARTEAAAKYGVAGASQTAMTTEETYRTALAQTSYQYDDNKTALENLTAAVEGYNTETMSALDTEEGWFASLDQLKKGIQDNGTSLDINTEAGRANRDNLEELSNKTKQLYIDQINSGVAVDQATATYNRNMQQVYDTAHALGFNKDQADALIKMYGGIPSNIQTQFSTPGYDETAGKLANLSARQYFLAHPKPDGSAPTVADIRAYNKDKGAGYAEGGEIVGPWRGPKADNMVARVTPGEVVQSNAAGDYYGRGFLLALNRRRIPKKMLPQFAAGGLVAPFPVSTAMTRIPSENEVENTFLRQFPIFAGGGVGGAGVQRWAPLVLAVLKMLGQSAGLLPNVLRRMNQESGGNPNAINLWDSNAMRGQPSQGLMQTIPGTFAAYAGPYLSRGIRDPLANIYAGLNYAIHRYRSLQYAMDKPGGYRNGGWLKPGQVGVNETSSPEPVLSTKQWTDVGDLVGAVKQLVDKIGGSPSKVINVGGIHVANRPTDVMQQIRFAEMAAGI